MNLSNKLKVGLLKVDLEDPNGPGSDFEMNSEKRKSDLTSVMPDASVERDLRIQGGVISDSDSDEMPN